MRRSSRAGQSPDFNRAVPLHHKAHPEKQTKISNFSSLQSDCRRGDAAQIFESLPILHQWLQYVGACPTQAVFTVRLPVSVAPAPADLSLAPPPHLLPLCTLQARPVPRSFITPWRVAAVCVWHRARCYTSACPLSRTWRAEEPENYNGADQCFTAQSGVKRAKVKPTRIRIKSCHRAETNEKSAQAVGGQITISALFTLTKRCQLLLEQWIWYYGSVHNSSYLIHLQIIKQRTNSEMHAGDVKTVPIKRISNIAK